MSEVYPVNPIDNTIYETAKQLAKARAKRHWDDFATDRQSACMWKTYHSELNEDWIDPWIESEVEGNDNQSPDWKQTQNMYMIYCWMRNKGYCPHSITGILASAIHESMVSGGVWETAWGGASKHPYSSMTAFDPTSLNSNVSNYTWYTGGVRLNYAGSAIQWTARFTDYTGHVWELTATPGSWDACQHWPILTEQVEIDGQMREMPVGYETDELQFNRSVSRGAGTGYGLVQWTPWVKLPQLCAASYYDGIMDFDEGNRHWQQSLTLHLMILERERYLAMNSPVQSGGSYLGQWVDSNAKQQSDLGAYIQWPYNPDSPYNRYYYPDDITWDEFAAGDYLEWADDVYEYLVQNVQDPPTADDLDWIRCQAALAIWRACFLQATYRDFGFQTTTAYILAGIRYWDENGGADIRDVPRARDIPNCELDQYHLTYKEFPALLQTTIHSRRRSRNVCSVLFRHH